MARAESRLVDVACRCPRPTLPDQHHHSEHEGSSPSRECATKTKASHRISRARVILAQMSLRRARIDAETEQIKDHEGTATALHGFLT